MTLAVRALAGAVVLLGAAVAALRWRKLRRDERRRTSRAVDRRLLRPPPSPYAPSRGFKLLDGAEPLEGRPSPERPRLDPDHEYVFSDAPAEDRPIGPGRHDRRWALERASRGTGISAGARVVLTLVVAVALVGGVGYALRRPHHPASATTTTAPAVTTTTDWPAVFDPVGSAAGRTYDVPAESYELTVSATGGATGVTVREGAAHALDYQATLSAGASHTVVVTGVGAVTLSTPANATLTLGGSPVRLPAGATGPLTLTFSPTG